MNIKIKVFDQNDKSEWNNFLSSSNNGTIFHNIDFLNYHPKERFNFKHLMFYENENLITILPGAVVNKQFISPMGASFGGFVFKDGISIKSANNVVKTFIKYCQNNNIKSIKITPPMQIYHDTMDEVFEYSMLYNGFIFGNSQYSSLIDLSKIKDKNNLSKNTRHKINKAINKHIRIIQNKNFSEFYPILLGNKAKFGVKPTHTLEELERIENLMPNMMTLFMAYLGDKPIAGELLFSANKNCVINFYTMHKYEHRNFFAVNYLVEQGIKWSAENGFRYYDYGVSQDTSSQNPLEPSWSLITFKESMESRGCMRKCYVLDL